MSEKFEPVAFTDVREGDRVQFVTANNGFDGGDQVWRTGTVTRVTDKSATVDCDTNVIGKTARLRRADWHYRCVSKAVAPAATARREALDRIRAKADAERAAYRAKADDQIAAECAEHGVPAPRGVAERIAARKAAEGEQGAPEGCGAVDAGDTTNYIVTADPQPAAVAEEEFTKHQARQILQYGDYPQADRFEPYRGQGGTFLGYTFQVGQLHSARYGWITPSGRYSKGLEAYRSTAANVLVHVAEDEGRLPKEPAPAPDPSNPKGMRSDDLLAYLRAAMEDVPADDLTRELWEELDRRMSGGHRPPSNWS